jgi:hypothetical protein
MTETPTFFSVIRIDDPEPDAPGAFLVHCQVCPIDHPSPVTAELVAAFIEEHRCA